MSDQSKSSSKSSAAFAAETQRERWLKYGANVLLTVLIVVLLGGFTVYIAQAHNLRKDTTAGGVYSLKAPTIRLIENLPQKVKIIGLFTKAKGQQELKEEEDADNPAVRYQQVSDLLQEYQQKSNGKITVYMIDPVTEPGKLDQLFLDVQQKYGNDINKYREVLDAYPKTLEEISRLVKEDSDAHHKLPKIEDRELSSLLRQVDSTLDIFTQILDQIKIGVKEQLALKVPDYKGAADNIKSGLTRLTRLTDAANKEFKSACENPKTPAEVKVYMTGAEPRFTQIKKTADDLLKKIEGLGELKQLDELRQNKRDSIAVLGETDLKVLPLSSIYKTTTARVLDAGKVKPRFAGEQQVSTALV